MLWYREEKVSFLIYSMAAECLCDSTCCESSLDLLWHSFRFSFFFFFELGQLKRCSWVCAWLNFCSARHRNCTLASVYSLLLSLECVVIFQIIVQVTRDSSSWTIALSVHRFGLFSFCTLNDCLQRLQKKWIGWDACPARFTIHQVFE